MALSPGVPLKLAPSCPLRGGLEEECRLNCRGTNFTPPGSLVQQRTFPHGRGKEGEGKGLRGGENETLEKDRS